MMLSFRVSRVLAAALLVVLCLPAAAKERPRPDRPASPATLLPTDFTFNIAPGLVIVKLREGVSFTAAGRETGVGSLDAVLQRIGADQVSALAPRPAALAKRVPGAEEAGVRRLVRIRYTSGVDPRTLAAELSGDPAVEYAEPYYVYPLSHTPNDPRISQQWALAMMKMQEAWDVTTGDSTIVIGSVDSGVDWQHEDLRGAIWTNPGEWGTSGELSSNGIDDDGNGKIDDWHGWDFIGGGTAQAPQPDNNPMDGAIGHGTGTSGCFGAVANNGIGIAGTGYRVKILPIKTGAESASLGILAGYEGIIYAIDMGCRVINCSWGGTGAFSQAAQDIINYAYAQGALVVGSSGNNPFDNDRLPHYPSSYNHVLNVGSIENTGQASTWCTYGTSVHVYAPGNGILTTRRAGGYDSPTGTSFSTPLVSGVAALIMSVRPTWTPDQVLKQIRVTADGFVNPPQPKRFGRVNAFRAVSLNATLTDIPGVLLKNTIVTTPSGTRFTAGGQTANVDVTLENVLAPTSDNATVTVEFEDAFVSTPTPTLALGALPTFGTKSLRFDVQLSGNPRTSEGFIPVRLKITDGSYVDYLHTSIQIYLDNGWHTALGNLDVPFFSSIHALNESVVWASVNITQNSNSVQNYVFRTPSGGNQWFFAGGSTSGGGFPAAAEGVYTVFGIDALSALIGTGPSSGAASVYRTTNGGQNWLGTSVSTITPFVNVVHMFDARNGILLGDPRNNRWGIGKTTDAGATWTALAQPLSAPASEAGWNNAYDFIGDTGWMGTNNSKIYKTTNRGESWTALPTPSVHSVDVSFRDLSTGVVRFSRQGTTGSDTLALTEDGGSTWRLISTIAAQYSSVVMERGGKRMWVLRNGNAFESSDLGATWTAQPVPGGFDPIVVVSNYSGSNVSHVWAAGWNVFSFISPSQPVLSAARPPLPSDLAIDDVYPQPAAGSALFTGFRVPGGLHAELAVYDAGGRLVTRVVEAVLAAGGHTARIDAAQLPAGAYHLRLTSGGRQVTRPFVVAR